MIGAVTSGNYVYQANYLVRPNEDLKISTMKNENSNEVKNLKQTGQIECETCKNRQYVDASDEGNVSFKTPRNISPESSRAIVSAHESEHVANARSEGLQSDAELISANVVLKTATCSECGKSYVAGGTTTTQIRYKNQENPYQKAKKGLDEILLKGRNIDYAA